MSDRFRAVSLDVQCAQVVCQCWRHLHCQGRGETGRCDLKALTAYEQQRCSTDAREESVWIHGNTSPAGRCPVARKHGSPRRGGSTRGTTCWDRVEARSRPSRCGLWWPTRRRGPSRTARRAGGAHQRGRPRSPAPPHRPLLSVRLPLKGPPSPPAALPQQVKQALLAGRADERSRDKRSPDVHYMSSAARD